MLVICDFLLLSMLALARFDPPEELPEAAPEATSSSAAAEAELIRLLEETLEYEQESRSELSKDLDETKQDLEEQARKLAEREARLAEAQKNLEAKAIETAKLAEAKLKIETEQQKLAAEKALVEAERQQLAEKFESARTKLEEVSSEQIELVQTLGQFKEKSSVSEERLSQAERDLLAREAALAQREAELKAAQEAAKKLQSEREQLQQQLQIALAERTLLEQTVSREQQEKQQLQAEKAQVLAHANRLSQNVTELGADVSQLGKGVNELVQTSEDIKKEIDASRPRTINEIFTRFQGNRAIIRFVSTEKPRIGSPDIHYYESKSVLVSEGAKTYLVTHVTDTPFVFYKNPDNLQSVSLSVSLSGRNFPITRVAFLKADPRILYILLPENILKVTDLETFELALQPDRWEEAVLIKNDESNFGSAEFKRMTYSDRFLEINRPVMGELFNDFASSSGDLAFSKNNQFIGLLTDAKHALVIDTFQPSAILELGENFDAAKYSDINKLVKEQLRKLPNEVR